MTPHFRFWIVKEFCHFLVEKSHWMFFRSATNVQTFLNINMACFAIMCNLFFANICTRTAFDKSFRSYMHLRFSEIYPKPVLHRDIAKPILRTECWRTFIFLTLSLMTSPLLNKRRWEEGEAGIHNVDSLVSGNGLVLIILKINIVSRKKIIGQSQKGSKHLHIRY